MSIDILSILSFLIFGLGACIASFLNVVIWRIPRGESIVSPRSHCPKCQAPIKWYQNIPILSWLALRGKCANCKAPISPRYILIESMGGILFLSVFWSCGLKGDILTAVLTMVVFWIWISLMIVGSAIDFDLKLLPDFVTVGGMILGVLWNGVLSFLGHTFGPIAYSLSGLAFGFGLLWLVRFFGSKAFHREAMGLGDVFLMGAVGALFGPVAVLFTLIVSSVFGSLIGLSMIALAKTRFGKFLEIPFGPFICLACLLWMFHGPAILTWYLNFLKI